MGVLENWIFSLQDHSNLVLPLNLWPLLYTSQENCYVKSVHYNIFPLKACPTFPLMAISALSFVFPLVHLWRAMLSFYENRVPHAALPPRYTHPVVSSANSSKVFSTCRNASKQRDQSFSTKHTCVPLVTKRYALSGLTTLAEVFAYYKIYLLSTEAAISLGCLFYVLGILLRLVKACIYWLGFFIDVTSASFLQFVHLTYYRILNCPSSILLPRRNFFSTIYNGEMNKTSVQGTESILC